jgi:hypothetical protein
MRGIALRDEAVARPALAYIEFDDACHHGK